MVLMNNNEYHQACRSSRNDLRVVEGLLRIDQLLCKCDYQIHELLCLNWIDRICCLGMLSRMINMKKGGCC
jgi:hypothetical protein